MTKDKLRCNSRQEFDAALPGVVFNFSQYIQDNVEEALSGVKGANSVKIIGPNLRVLEDYAGRILKDMERVKGMADVGIFHIVGQPNLNIRVDRVRAARYGLNSGDVNNVVQAAMAGSVASTVLESDRQFNLTVRLAPKYRDSVAGYARCRSPIRRRPERRLISRCASWPTSASTPALPSFITKERSVISPSSSVCAAAISAARSRKPRRSSRKTSSCPTAIASSGRASSRTCRTRSSGSWCSCPSVSA